MAIKIYIDQGHNPSSPNAGAEGNGLKEQDITYRIGTDLANLLRQNPNFEVRLSRPSPTTSLGTSNASSLSARTNAANAWGADYFISLHTNAFTNPNPTGVEGYVFEKNSSAGRLATDIVDRISDATGLVNRGVFSRPGLWVLKKTQMPAVLIEMGYISNPNDAALMRDNPMLFARAIYNGILEYTGV